MRIYEENNVVFKTGSNRFEPVRFLYFRELELQLKVQSFAVQSGLSPVFFRSYGLDF